MHKKIEGGPKGLSGEQLLVYGSMTVEKYRNSLGTQFRQVNILPINEQVVAAELRLLPGSRLELHPRLSEGGIVDLVPTVFNPALRIPVLVDREAKKVRD